MDSPLKIPKQEKEGALVMVVERDPFYRHYIESFFRKARLELEFVTDGVTAMKRIKGRKPDLIITEAVIPRIDGLSLCKLVREDKSVSDVPIIVFSVLDLEEEAIEAGADSFLSKPFEENAFAKTVSQFLQLEEKEQTV